MLPPSIDDALAYLGADLGNSYSSAFTHFRVWAPLAREVQLVVLRGAEEIVPMARDVQGTWVVTVHGDLHRVAYLYRANVEGVWRDSVDPYARTSTINGGASVVVDLERTTPAHWTSDRPQFSGESVDAVFYEVHTRDFSIDATSGVRAQWKGKWLGFTDHGTMTQTGNRTGIDTIRELGVTHLQLLPIYDFGSVDESRPDAYNWGYDPVQYNVPEGSYSTSPADPCSRIIELKATIQSLHDDGLRVVMDVVYNHVFDAKSHAFERLTPGYFFRMRDDGTYGDASACGNEIASERVMVRKYIVDSVAYWAREFHLDGFRFDLMGILDVETMRQVRHALDEIDPSILVIGEGWSMGDLLAPERRADQQNAVQMPGIGHFNDGFRDGIKGSVFRAAEPGYVQGRLASRAAVIDGIVGNVRFSETVGGDWGETSPGQAVNYVEAHDNLTLWDKLEASMPDANIEERVRAFRVATSIALLAQGVPFLHAGQEFMRSKLGDDNSFQSGDAVNAIRWDERIARFDMVEFVRSLIALRKAHPAFRMRSADAIRANMRLLPTQESVVAYAINGVAARDTWSEIVVAHNVGREPARVNLPANAVWGIAVDEWRAGMTVPMRSAASFVEVGPLSTMVLYR